MIQLFRVFAQTASSPSLSTVRDAGDECSAAEHLQWIGIVDNLRRTCPGKCRRWNAERGTEVDPGGRQEGDGAV
jgi:hypothetical protein